MSRDQAQPTPAQIVQGVEVLRNPMLAQFLVAELAEHKACVEDAANGSLLVGPRMNVVQQLIFQLCGLHGLDQPAAAHRTPGPSGEGHPGGSV